MEASADALRRMRDLIAALPEAGAEIPGKKGWVEIILEVDGHPRATLSLGQGGQWLPRGRKDICDALPELLGEVRCSLETVLAGFHSGQRVAMERREHVPPAEG